MSTMILTRKGPNVALLKCLMVLLVSTLLFVISASGGKESNGNILDEPDTIVTGVRKAGHFQLDVLVARDALVVAVDNTVIVEDKDVGVHLVVLDERHGELLQHRFYNIAVRFWSEQLVHFINTIKDGRIVIIASQVVSSENFGIVTQRHLSLMGSQYAKSLTWKGHWAMVVEKGYPVLAEDRTSGSMGVNGPDVWGGPVHLHVDVALKLDEGTKDATCGNLLKTGYLSEFNEWQPDGCRMHQYSSAEAKSCFQRVKGTGRITHLAFIGDSRVRNLYAAFVHHIDPLHVVVRTPSDKTINHTYVDADMGLLVEYFFNPFVDANMSGYFKLWSSQDDPPRLIVAGNAAWKIRAVNGELRGVQEYAGNLALLVPAIDDITKKQSTVIWTLQEPPVYERIKINQKHFTEEQFFLYNDAAIKTLRPSSARIWSSIRRIAEGNLIDSVDGIHHGQMALLQEAQILFNFYCNSYMQLGTDTCCSKMN